MRLRLWLLIFLVLATAGYTRFLADVHAVPLRKPLASVPASLGEWNGRSDRMEDRIVQVVGVEDYLLREYRNESGAPVMVYVGYYEQQKEGDQVHSPKHCLPGAGWRPEESTVVDLDTPGFNGGRTPASRNVIAKGDERQFVLYWYLGAGRVITNEYAAKFYLVLDSIFRKRNDGALVRFMVPMGGADSADQAQARVESLARVLLPEVAKALPE